MPATRAAMAMATRVSGFKLRMVFSMAWATPNKVVTVVAILVAIACKLNAMSINPRTPTKVAIVGMLSAINPKKSLNAGTKVSMMKSLTPWKAGTRVSSKKGTNVVVKKSVKPTAIEIGRAHV